MNAFEQLTAWLQDGTLSRTHLSIAYRASIRGQQNIPEGARNLAEPMLKRLFNHAEELVGSLELAYRRGNQKEEVMTFGFEGIPPGIQKKDEEIRCNGS